LLVPPDIDRIDLKVSGLTESQARLDPVLSGLATQGSRRASRSLLTLRNLD
jgi:hypothetical protein